jgi:hypothetical protein
VLARWRNASFMGRSSVRFKTGSPHSFIVSTVFAVVGLWKEYVQVKACILFPFFVHLLAPVRVYIKD